MSTKAATAERIIGIGHNSPPTDQETLLEFLDEKATTLEKKAAEIQDALTRMPAEIDSDEWEEKLLVLASQAKTCATKFEDMREANKKPFWDAGKIVDGFFKTKIAGMETAQKKVVAVMEAYRAKKREAAAKEAAEAAARARKQEQDRLDAAAELEKQAKEKQAEADRLAEQAKAASPEAKAEAEAVAAEATKQAEKLQTTADKKLDSAVRMESRGDKFETLAGTGGRAAITRSDTGAAAVDKKTWVVEVIDLEHVDLETLRGHFSLDDIQKAANSLKNQYVRDLKENKDTPIPVVRGLKIWLKTETVVR